MADQTLTCSTCAKPFRFTEAQQLYLWRISAAGTPPRRCPSCREELKDYKRAKGYSMKGKRTPRYPNYGS